MPIATPSRKWSYAYHESHILTWRFTKRQVGMPYECWLLQATGNCCLKSRRAWYAWPRAPCSAPLRGGAPSAPHTATCPQDASTPELPGTHDLPGAEGPPAPNMA